MDEGGGGGNGNGNGNGNDISGGLRSRVDNLAARLGNQQKRTRLLNAAVCSDILLLRTPFFFGYALGRFSYSFSWMFLVCQISNATFTASRSRCSDKRPTFNLNSLPSAAANVATCIEWNLHVLAVLILSWILGALGWDVLVVGLLTELVCIVDLRREVVIRRIAALLPASKDDESVHGHKPGLKRHNSEDKAFRGSSEGGKSRKVKGGAMGEGVRCAKEMEKSRLSQAEVTTVKVKDEWLNMLFATFWQTYGPWASQYVAAQLEYWITDLGLEVEFCSVGTVPLAIKSTRGYPQAKFSRHEGRGDSEFHSDPELTFDLDLDIELISDLRIKLSYQGVPILIEKLALTGVLCVRIQWLEIDHRDIKFFPNLSFMSLQLKEEPPELSLQLKVMGMVDLFRMPLLESLPKYVSNWLYGFMGPPNEWEIITGDTRKEMKKQVVAYRRGGALEHGVDVEGDEQLMRIVVAVESASNLPQTRGKFPKDTYVRVRCAPQSILEDEGSLRVGIEARTLTYPGRSECPNWGTMLMPFDMSAGENVMVEATLFSLNRSGEDKIVGSWSSSLKHVREKAHLRPNGPKRVHTVRLLKQGAAGDKEEQGSGGEGGDGQGDGDGDGDGEEGQRSLFGGEAKDGQLDLRFQILAIDPYPLQDAKMNSKLIHTSACVCPGTLTLWVLKCSALPAMDGGPSGLNDVYVRVISGKEEDFQTQSLIGAWGELVPLGWEAEEPARLGDDIFVQRTSILYKTNKPAWEGEKGMFDLPMDNCEAGLTRVYLQVWDHDKGFVTTGHDDYIGGVELKIHDMVWDATKGLFTTSEAEQENLVLPLLNSKGEAVTYGGLHSTISVRCHFRPSEPLQALGKGRELSVKVLNCSRLLLSAVPSERPSIRVDIRVGYGREWSSKGENEWRTAPLEVVNDEPTWTRANGNQFQIEGVDGTDWKELPTNEEGAELVMMVRLVERVKGKPPRVVGDWVESVSQMYDNMAGISGDIVCVLTQLGKPSYTTFVGSGLTSISRIATSAAAAAAAAPIQLGLLLPSSQPQSSIGPVSNLASIQVAAAAGRDGQEAVEGGGSMEPSKMGGKSDARSAMLKTSGSWKDSFKGSFSLGRRGTPSGPFGISVVDKKAPRTASSDDPPQRQQQQQQKGAVEKGPGGLHRSGLVTMNIMFK